MRFLFHPAVEDISVEGILYALGDPMRAAIFMNIAASECARSCSNFLKLSEREIPKSTLSLHFKVLREAGLIRSERRGVEMLNRSRCQEIDMRFPGLLEAIGTAYRIQSAAAGRGGDPADRAERE